MFSDTFCHGYMLHFIYQFSLQWIAISVYCSSYMQIHAETVINGVWHDDFQQDSTEETGWYIYNEEGSSDLGNRFIQGDAFLYHGPFMQEPQRTFLSQHTWMKRRFRCLKDSTVYIHYSYAFCSTESTDTITLITPTITAEENMNRRIASSLDTFEPTSGSFEQQWLQLPQRDNKRRCDFTNDDWFYKITSLDMGIVDQTTIFELSWRTRLSSKIEYAFIFNVHINCVSLPTHQPTNEPTLAPSLSPSVVPTNTPTLAPTSAPSSTPTIPPSSNPSHSPTHPP
eukprot:223213_1